MRWYYTTKNANGNPKIDGLTRAKEFSYETIGNLMKGILSE
jgi:hypothetical protein